MSKVCRECKQRITRSSKLGFCKSCSHKGHRNIWYKKQLPEELKKKISETRTKLGIAKGKNNPNFKNARPFCNDCGLRINHQRKRCSLCHHKFLFNKIGNKNPNWKKGISFLPYSSEFNKSLKEEIKKRDNYTCQHCGIKYSLSIHHIDYDKNNNHQDNLITLCVKCNSKVNSHRDVWRLFFKAHIEFQKVVERLYKNEKT